MWRIAVVTAIFIQVASAQTRPAFNAGEPFVFTKVVASGGVLVVRAERVRNAPPDPVVDAELARALPPGFLPGAGTNFTWRLTAWISPDQRSAGRLLWLREWPDDMFDVNSCNIYDAAIVENSAIILYRCGVRMRAEVARADVAGFSMLSTAPLPANRTTIVLPNKDGLVDRTDLSFNPGKLQGHISGTTLSTLEVTVGGNRREMKFKLVPDGERFRWVREDAAPATQPTTKSGS